MTTSAYMIAHCDDDFLQAAIDSVIDHVDEFIFVDGAYAWIASSFETVGLDPSRSWQTTHDILARYGDKIRYFSGVWDDELHKRSFGYSQCRGDIIIRIDADEIFEWDDAAYEDFLHSDKSIAEMAFPYLLGARAQRLDAATTQTPKQACVFKAARLSTALEHCAYLWLVLTDDERSRCGAPDWRGLYAEPVINTAHLTAMRTPRTAVNRARFYTFQHVRTTGSLSWPYQQRPVARPEDRIAQIFDFLTPEELSSWLEGQEIVSGFAHMKGYRVAPVTFGDAVTQQIEQASACHDQALYALLDFAAHPRTVISDVITQIDVTALLRRGVSQFELEFADDMEHVTGHLHLLLDTTEDQSGRNLEPVHSHTDGRIVTSFFQPLDMSKVMQAVFVLNPVIKGAQKTRLIRFSS